MIVWNTPINNTAAKRYSSPCEATNAPITTAIAAVELEINHGLHVSNPQTNPITIAHCKLISGLTHATKANATDSGMSASATVTPDKVSVIRAEGLLLKK